MAINSRNKGKTGELDLAAFLRDHGFQARRGRQYCGAEDAPDVVHSVPGIHIECKRTERFNLYDALAQAKADAGDKTPVVAHRRNRCEWVAVLRLEDFLALVAEARA